MLTQQQLIEIEFGGIKTLQGGRIESYTEDKICWQPYKHSTIGLYNGKLWLPVTPNQAVISSDTPTTISGQTLTSGINYDVFGVYRDDTYFDFAFQPWATASGRFEDPQRFEGVLVHNLTADGKKRRFLGTVRLDGVTGVPKFMDSVTQRFIVNWYNIKESVVRTYNSSTANYQYQTPNNTYWYEYGTGNSAILAAQVRGEFLHIHPIDLVSGAFSVSRYPTGMTYGRWHYVAMCLNTTTRPLYPIAYEDQDDNYPYEHFDSGGISYGQPYIGYNWISIVYRGDSNSSHPNFCMTNSYPGDIGSGFLKVFV